jgi:hypothetical protein
MSPKASEQSSVPDPIAGDAAIFWPARQSYPALSKTTPDDYLTSPRRVLDHRGGQDQLPMRGFFGVRQHGFLIFAVVVHQPGPTFSVTVCADWAVSTVICARHTMIHADYCVFWHSQQVRHAADVFGF